MENKHPAQYIKNLIDMIICSLIMYITYMGLPKNIWIISERADQAQDNGIAFFEYLNKMHPEVKSYYLLDKNCNKISQVSKIGKVLIKGSLKHKIYFLKSNVLAFTEKNIIEPWGSNIFYKYFAPLYPKKLKVFLQHGILDKDVSGVYGKAISNIDLFVASSKLEEQFVIDKFGYLPEEVANVGISRCDKLAINKEKKENIILYMPTWRRYLIDLAVEDKEYIDKARQEFTQSRYYQGIQAVLNSVELNTLLERYKFKLIMVTHHAMNELGDALTYNSSNIQVYKSEDVEIRHLLQQAKIFITDYSSVHFDSAYLENTNIYYQFDQEEFQQEHAGKSYFSYEKQGFGSVVMNLSDLLSEIEESIKNQSQRSEKYNKRAEDFFEFKDGRNSERLYKQINKLISKKE